MNPPLLLVLPAWRRGKEQAQLLLSDDGGLFPDAKCIIPLVLPCLPSESITTVRYRTEQRVKQKCDKTILLAGCAQGKMSTMSLACMPAQSSPFVCILKEF